MKARLLPPCLLLLLACACGRPAPERAGDGRLRVAATTSILGDVVAAVGGPDIHLTVLLQPGQDPHSFNPTPADLAALSRSQVLFANGLGLETFLDRLPPGPAVAPVSRGLPALRMDPEECHEAEEDHAHDHPAEGGLDPHVWFDPLLVSRWTEAIEAELGRRDPARREAFRERAASYRVQLEALDAWIREQVATLPPERRRLVSDHAVLNYFAARYGFSVAGVIVPSFSTAAEPSARELAALEDTIRRERIPALFLTSTASPALGERLAADTGVRVAIFYDGSLGPPGSPASTYLGFMRHNVSLFIGALKD